MNEKFTKEQIEQIVNDALIKVSSNIPAKYAESLEKIESYSDEYKNNPIACSIAAIPVVEADCAEMLKDIICKLLEL